MCILDRKGDGGQGDGVKGDRAAELVCNGDHRGLGQHRLHEGNRVERALDEEVVEASVGGGAVEDD